MKHYKCEICGKKHQVYYGIKAAMAKKIWELSEDEKATRLFEQDGIYLLDKKRAFFLAKIFIPNSKNETTLFDWEVWVSVDAKDFYKKIESKKPTAGGFSFKGELESELLYYENLIGLEVEMQIDFSKPDLTVIITENSELKEDQVKGVDKDRIMALMHKIHHRDEYLEQKSFDQPFGERLTIVLEEIKNKWRLEGNFVLNISNSSEVLFQIVTRQLLESVKDDQFGYGVHIPLDDSIEELEPIRKQLSSKPYKNSLKYINLDEIPTYQKDFALDYERMADFLVKLIEEVFKEETTKIALDYFEV